MQTKRHKNPPGNVTISGWIFYQKIRNSTLHLPVYFVQFAFDL